MLILQSCHLGRVWQVNGVGLMGTMVQQSLLMFTLIIASVITLLHLCLLPWWCSQLCKCFFLWWISGWRWFRMVTVWVAQFNIQHVTTLIQIFIASCSSQCGFSQRVMANGAVFWVHLQDGSCWPVQYLFCIPSGILVDVFRHHLWRDSDSFHRSGRQRWGDNGPAKCGSWMYYSSDTVSGTNGKWWLRNQHLLLLSHRSHL